CLPRRVPEQPLLPRFEEFLAPAVVQVGRKPLAAAQLRHAFLAPQPLQDNADLLLGGEPAPRPPVDLPHDLLGPRSLAHPLPPSPIRFRLPVGPGASLSSMPYVVHIALTPHTLRVRLLRNKRSIMGMVLYEMAMSPNAKRARLGLAETGAPFERREVNLLAGE